MDNLHSFLRKVECEIYVYWIYIVLYMKKRSRNI